jgi:D-glutamate cyclase
MKGLAEAIDKLMTVEFRRDGVLDGIIEPLYQAAREQVGEPLAWRAATKLREAASSGRPIYIATGHVHPIALPAGETDGPPGAAALARALVKCGSSPVILLCEAAVTRTLAATCAAAGLSVRTNPDDLPMPGSVAIQPFPVDLADARILSKRLARDCAGIVTIEKIGRAKDGGYYTGRASVVTQELAKIDELVDIMNRQGALTIGVGDLGNEIGMGKIAAVVEAVVPGGQVFACAVPTEELLVAACSNWGAYAMTAALAGMERNLDLFHTAEIEREMISQCCRAGGVDGFSAAPTMEVDGAHWSTHAAFVQLLRDVVEISTNQRVPDRHRLERS